MNQVGLEQVTIEKEIFFKISHVDNMRPFLMNIVSDSNHWMFISSNGGLTAGRKNSNHALFPYYTDDKLTESADVTGSKSIFYIENKGKKHIWEPFSECFIHKYKISRNLYKNIYGNKIIFEEINHDLGITFSYQWNTSNTYGFIKKSKLVNHSNNALEIALIDGIQNIIPSGVSSDTQNQVSNLVDAYKRSELHKPSGLGLFALSAMIVDKAEPSEALKTNVVWSLGIEKAVYLLSSLQLQNFREGIEIKGETDIKGEKGAYFIHHKLRLSSHDEKDWIFIADVNKNHTDVVGLINQITTDKNLYTTICQKIEEGTQRLIALNASSDALQVTRDSLRDTRHFSNTLFNVMRGGIFDFNYQIEPWDILSYLQKANKRVYEQYKSLFSHFSETFSVFELKDIAYKSGNQDFIRLCTEYLPLRFSRRHGDPSRPWNKFSINTRSEIDGSKILDYEGNWRDIFQNWEALAHSFPEFIEGMIFKFLNASTFEGYNPYRVTKDGFDWETIEPDDPWSYIGYWGDHQIIYLLKFLELLENHKQGKLVEYFDKDWFVYAYVPYTIKPYEYIIKNPKDTIDFDSKRDSQIRLWRKEIGADGALITDNNGAIIHVNLIEKILATTLAKMSNFIPEAGIWMNTQRPEWNDANNALVGNGVSMVTLYYLRRFFSFFKKILTQTKLESVKVSYELVDFYKQVRQILEEHVHLLDSKFTNNHRKTIIKLLGSAASEFRWQIYEQGFWGKKRSISIDGLKYFVSLSLNFLEHTISVNKRTDNMYHAYNLITFKNNDQVSISYLSEMLEGQVAVLSSGYLSSAQALEVLNAMKKSKLFRKDQYSYLLYPNKDLPGFLQKNNISVATIEKSELLQKMIAHNDISIIQKDIKGSYHFNGNFKNANDVKEALERLKSTHYAPLAKREKYMILEIFEKVFNHKAFTGRSGTFYGYEGLGSIYWHMVSKLQLAVQEVCLQAIANNTEATIVGKLLEHYYEINEGIGVHKSPVLYGAFPTDPYSHTPAGKGAQQPGMTGQVKEDIISRYGELGVFVKNGKLQFNPCMLRKKEFLLTEKIFYYLNVNGAKASLKTPTKSLAFTYCQVPIVFHVSNKNKVEVETHDTTKYITDSLSLNKEMSKEIFKRTGKVTRIDVFLDEHILK
jgi:hypothetical protein